MTDVPAATPLTTPVAPIVAIVVVMLLQVPPATEAVSGVVLPTQTLSVPEMTGMPLTTTEAEAEQPEAVLKDMVTVPAATPVTMPVVAPTVAVAVLLLLQVPAPAASASVVVAPTQSDVVPVTGAMADTLTI